MKPPEGAWIPLLNALGWICSRHADQPNELEPALASPSGEIDGSLLSRLQEAWRELADHASVGRVTIRGHRQGESRERTLGIDDVRNCRYLACSPVAEDRLASAGITAVGAERNHLVLRVERYDDTYSGHWRRLGDSSGYDFEDLMVSGPELIQLYPPVRRQLRKLRSIAAAETRALLWLESELDSVPPRSRPKATFLERLKTDFGLSVSRSLYVWRQATETRLDWMRPGRPRKIASDKIDFK